MEHRLRSSVPMIPNCLDTDTFTKMRKDLIYQQGMLQQEFQAINPAQAK